jgi:RHS repeat-associated protein
MNPSFGQRFLSRIANPLKLVFRYTSCGLRWLGFIVLVLSADVFAANSWQLGGLSFYANQASADAAPNWANRGFMLSGPTWSRQGMYAAVGNPKLAPGQPVVRVAPGRTCWGNVDTYGKGNGAGGTIYQNYYYVWCSDTYMGPTVPNLQPEKSLGHPKPGQCIGNPCNPGNGNKYQPEVDYRSPDATLSFTRSYNSLLGWDMGLGVNWSSPFYRRLELQGNLVQVRSGDGRGQPFTCANNICTGDVDNKLILTQDSSGYTLTYRDNATDRYDTTGKLLAETSPTGQITNYFYRADTGKLDHVIGPFGHTLTFGYDAYVRISTLTNPTGQVIRFSYSSNYNLSRVDYPDNTAKIYYYEGGTYNPYALTGIAYVDSSGVTTRFSTYGYNTTTGKAILTQHAQTDNGSPQEKFTLIYNSDTQTTVTNTVNMQEVMTFATNLGVKNLTQKVNQSDSKIVNQTFDANNNLTCQKDEEGRVTTYTFNTTNQRTGMTEGLTGNCTSPVSNPGVTRTISYQYFSPTLDLPTFISSTSVASGQNKTTTIQYTDAAHPNLPTVISQNGFTPSGASVSRTIGMSYNAAGQVSSIDGPRTDVNDVTTLQYNSCTTGYGCGQLSQVTNALGRVTTYDSYDASGRVTQITDPNGLRSNYTYNARGRVITVTLTPPAGTAQITSYAYNPSGDVTSVTFPDGRILTYTYDAALYLRQVTDNLGNQIRYKYDLKGNRTQTYTYDPSSTLVRKIDSAYDIRNHITSINAAGSITQQVSDAVGNLTRETDPKNNPATTHGYDALNRLMQTIDALSGTTAVSYDVNDRVKQVTAPNNASTQYLYDDLGNLLQETGLDRGNISYSYDAAGNVIYQTDARGVSASYAYDALNRLTSVDYPGTAEDITYTYDTGTNCTAGVGRPCQVVDASGTTQYGYDAFGNITQQRKTELGVTYITSYAYDAGNRLTSVTYPDGRNVTYTRDAVGRISGVTTTVNGSNQTIVSGRTYRADGLLLTQNYGNGLNETRTYDLQGRLTNQALGTADTRVYGFDANSNVTSAQNAFQTGSYGYDALDRLIQDSITSIPSSSVALGYDANGNRTSDGGGSYIYLSASNRLSQYHGQTITLDAAGNTVSDGTYTYAYNNAGQLQSVSQGATLGSYVYNHQRQRTRKTTAAGTTVFHYDLAGNLIAETQADGTPLRAYVWADNNPIAQVSSGSPETLAYLHTDHEGTPRLATDAGRAVVWRFEGRAFGDTAPTGSLTVNLRYPSQYFDAETGLHYNWHRYYDPKIGRYISSDPIGLAGGLNAYLYARANPLRYIDPTGLDVTIKIIRDTYTDSSVTGTIAVTSDRVPDAFSGFTLESAYAGENGDKNPIPPGTYSAFVRRDHNPNRIELKNFPGFENIQIHVGNEPDDVEGCFAVGTKRSRDWVGPSTPAIKKILQIIQKDNTGNITVNVSGPGVR